MTEFLLDTHALIWWWLDDPMLSKSARAIIEEEQGSIFVSAVSTYEIANKVRRSDWPMLAAVLEDLDDTLKTDGFLHLSLSSRHARHAGLLAGDHRDPFDRMIAAQGLIENMTIITRDREIAKFGCKVLW